MNLPPLPKLAALALLGLVVLYSLGIAAFALLHYEAGRPGFGRVVCDFHSWIGLGSGADRRAPLPPPMFAPPPPPPPPPPAPPPDPAVVPAADEHASRVARAEELVEKAEEQARVLRTLDRGAAFDEKRLEVHALVGEAREILIAVLDAKPEHRRANDVWHRLQQVQNAVRHL